MGTTSVRDLESLQIHELRTSPATVAGDTEFNTDPEEVAETIAALREIQFDCWNIDEERMTFNIVCMMQGPSCVCVCCARTRAPGLSGYPFVFVCFFFSSFSISYLLAPTADTLLACRPRVDRPGVD